VARTEQVCRMLRLLPNPGLADGPLADPPRIDLDASDSAAFYIAEKSVGTHPIPVRRATSEPQGRLGNWRVQPRLETPAWQRLARLIEEGARSDLDARLLTGLRHLGEATADFSAAAAVVGSLTAVRGMIGAPEGGETSALADAVARLARSTGTGPAASPRSVPPGREDQGPEVRARFAAVASLGEQLAHDLECTVTPELRADAVWLAFGVLEALLERPELRGYRDLQALLASPT